MGPTGNCVVSLGMGQTGRDLASDLRRRDGSNVFALAAPQVPRFTLTAFEYETAPAVWDRLGPPFLPVGLGAEKPEVRVGLSTRALVPIGTMI